MNDNSVTVNVKKQTKFFYAYKFSYYHESGIKGEWIVCPFVYEKFYWNVFNELKINLKNSTLFEPNQKSNPWNDFIA